MIHEAICKLCGCPDDSVYVICIKQCILCSRCQQNPVIRKMLIDCTIPMDTSHKSNWHLLTGTCPICSSTMSDPMLASIIKFKEIFNNITKSSNDLEHMVSIYKYKNINKFYICWILINI